MDRQPIATAPHDGTLIDLWYKWTDDDQRPEDRLPDCYWSIGFWRNHDGFLPDGITFTHWRRPQEAPA
jgi:hypothetical protein